MEDLQNIAKAAVTYFAVLALLVVLALVWHRAHETQAATPTGITASSEVGEP